MSTRTYFINFTFVSENVQNQILRYRRSPLPLRCFQFLFGNTMGYSSIYLLSPGTWRDVFFLATFSFPHLPPLWSFFPKSFPEQTNLFFLLSVWETSPVRNGIATHTLHPLSHTPTNKAALSIPRKCVTIC